jgi:hypothetical protein
MLASVSRSSPLSAPALSHLRERIGVRGAFLRNQILSLLFDAIAPHPTFSHALECRPLPQAGEVNFECGTRIQVSTTREICRFYRMFFHRLRLKPDSRGLVPSIHSRGAMQ